MQSTTILFAFLAACFSSHHALLLRRYSCRHYKKCTSNLCLNGGVCDKLKIHTGKPICICPEGFTGERCEINVCDCNDCQNGTCKADKCNKRGYTCSCFPGYNGDNCEGDVCDNHECVNGTRVPDQSSGRGYTCNCTTGYVGENCQVGVCDNNECVNGTCEADQSSERGYKCNCLNHHFGENCEVRLPRDCKEHHENGKTTTGVYEIYPYETVPSSISVLCDMETLNRGWTAIQKRVDGSVSFNKTWDEYKAGFGIPEQEDFWIGNELIYQLTKGNDSSLYVSITLVNGTTLYEVYERFSISNETEKYQLDLSGTPTGTLGDKMQEWGAGGNFFSTWDRDHDRMGTSNCAGSYGGGWWFSACYYAFLNGQWASTDWFQPWFRIVHKGSDIMETKMMMKRF